MRTKIFFSFLMAFALLIMSCSDGEGSGSAEGTGRLSVQLTDAPFPYDLLAEANVTVYKIEARLIDGDDSDDNSDDDSSDDDSSNDDSSDDSSSDDSNDDSDDDSDDDSYPYITLMEEEIEVNLLELTNGLTQELAEIDVPAGAYDLIRVYVKGVNVVLTDGTVYDLKVPSGDSSGIKVFIDPAITVTGGLSADLLLDFDVSRSFVAKGNLNTPAGVNGFNFKPVIKASNLSTSGTLAGNVSTVEEETSVALEGAQISVIAADTLNTTSFSDVDGNYAILGLKAGMYKVVAELDGYLASDTLDVQIDAANVTTQDFILEVDPDAATEEETTGDGN
ncbi:MAG: DUF4382 domain-containing protein [Bacteroidota bacterium]|uniref:DUF4382 domain-containing protein n=1 Tax=Flagellimonas okinawensis TaxID=3031324 RepID=A0ABT5XJ57_9FLAO|nr:DUF4382 domain-containing protein [[Muricauda] okinawensis]MDF0705919.1 DUF4382 domain-containing protein [[Muricauda] okinawensis]MEC8832377.1 DUF4382 domain-containing protein [Bacteroidota bacterium]